MLVPLLIYFAAPNILLYDGEQYESYLSALIFDIYILLYQGREKNGAN